MPKPPSHPRYQAVARAEPYPSSANRSGGGNNHGGGHGHSGRGSTERMYHPTGSVSTAGVTPGVPPAHQQSAAPPNFGYGPNTGIGAGSGPGASGMMNPQYGSEFPATTTTSTPRTIPRNFGQQSSPSSSTYGQSFDSSLQGPNQHNSSPSSAPNFQLTGYQHQNHPLQQPLQHQSLQHHHQHQHQQEHQSPTITNQNAAHHPHPTQFPPQPQPQSQPQQQQQQNQQQHQPRSQSHHQPPQAQAAHPNQTPIPNPPTHNNPRPNSPNHNPTTTWTPPEDTLLLSSRASQLPWSELQRLHFPSKTANACRKRHERLIEKRQAEEQVDEDRLARIAGEYVRMREELWKGLAEKVGMGVQEVEERCLGWGLGGLRVAGRRGGRRRGEGRGEGREGMGRRYGGGGGFPTVATGTGVGGVVGVGPVSTAMPMILGQGHGLGQGQGQGQVQCDGEKGRNYTHSPVQMGSTGTGQSPTQPGPGPGVGMVGPGLGAGPGHRMGHGIGMGMLPPQTAPPLTTLVPITATAAGHGFTSSLPTSSAPGMGTGISPPPPPLSLMQQQQPRVAFGGYLNGRSTSRRPTHPLTSAPPLASAPVNVNPPGPGGYQEGQGQQWTQQGGVNPVSAVGGTVGFAQNQSAPITGQTRQEQQPWSGATYPPSSLG